MATGKRYDETVKPGGTLSAAWTLALLDAFERLGLDSETLCRAALIDKDALDDPDHRISRDASGRLWRAALRDSGDVLLGLHAGAVVQLRVNHLVHLLLVSADTLGEGVRIAIHYQELLAHGRVVSLEGKPGHFRLRLHRVERVLPLLDQEVEFMAAAFLHLFRLATSTTFALQKVQFAHAPLGRTDQYERVFGCPVTFGAQHTELFLDPATWNLPLTHHSASLQAQFKLIAASTRQVSRSADTTSAVSERARVLVSSGHCGIEEIAAAMYTTARTLQRRLADEGTTFRDVLDDTRRRVVIDCVERRCNIEDMLHLAGFSDIRALRRALRRWGVEIAKGT